MNSPVVSRKRIRKLLQQINPRASGRKMHDKSHLFRIGVLDSISTVQLVLKLEEEFNIAFDLQDVTGANFRSVNRLVKLLVERYGLEDSGD